ncbi:hypothetical protein RI129_003374 [Pyrocoelia pectoralis]|uniref:Uncharacterized protein n=1 Tax=Pyrocoelia pectoralis TaxID=417401 RepID=A0AAN7ZN36_9COLE
MAAPDLVDSHDDEGFTPLHLAVIAGNMPLVTFLLANNADVNAVDNEKHTVVHWATVCGETVSLRAILAAGAPVSTPDVHGGYPLHYAAQMCGGEKDPSLGLQVLYTLLSNEDINVSVEDGEGRPPLLWAASAGSAKAVLALIRAGSSVESHDKDGLTALHCAASRGHTDCIDTLLTLCAASPDVIDITLGHADATALLLSHSADPNRQDRKGRSPAHCGCAKGQFETVKMLSSHGANLWLRNARGDLPLHEAAASGRRDLVRWLLESRPSQVNARNNDGRCPLHLAALNDNADMCKILIDTGAHINPVLRTSKNALMTPMDCALQRGFRSTAKYLQLHGGVPASRLTGPSQGPAVASAVSLQIRDDVTLWGGTSSEGESEDIKQKKIKKKMYKKKLDYKYEKKREPISLSDLEPTKLGDNGDVNSVPSSKKDSSVERKDATTSIDKADTHPNEIIIYANEVNINDKFGDIRIERTNENTEPNSISNEQNKINIPCTKRNSGSSDRRPKSAKYGRFKNKGKKSLDNGGEVNQIGENLIVDKQDEINTPVECVNGREDKNIVPVEEAQPDIATFVDNEISSRLTQSNGQSARSNTSLEDEDNHKEMIVEVSVHSPPKETQAQTQEAPLNSSKIEAQVKPHEENVTEKATSESTVETITKNDAPARQVVDEISNITNAIQNKEQNGVTDKVDSDDHRILTDTVLNVTDKTGEGQHDDNVTKENKIKTESLNIELVERVVTNEETVSNLDNIDNSSNDNSLLNKIDVTITSKNNNIQDLNDKEKNLVTSHEVQLTEINGDASSQLKPAVSKEPKSPRPTKVTNQLSEDESSSSILTVTPKQHKSFTVLNDNELRLEKKKSTSENGSPKKFNQHERLRRSKIPTPIVNLQSHLSKSDRYLERSKQEQPGIDVRVPSLPNIYAAKGMELKDTRPVSNLSAPLASTYSDNDIETGSEGENISSAARRKKLRKRSRGRNAKSAGSDYDSNLIDSGFEPSPRSTRIPKSKNMSERGVNMTSVTQTIQSNIRRYHLERKIFQHLLDLKRLQIRSGQHNESVLVKRAVDAYHRSCAATVGAGRYLSQDYTFKDFESFLYNSLRKIQKNGSEHLNGLPEAPRNPLHCTQSTHRCDHATHAYTGVPCAAYLPKMNHHNIPKIGFECEPSNFLPKITSKNAVTLELCHGNDKQVISLPAERLDQNKRYYVTFTVKGSDEKSTSNGSISNSHLHSKSD